MIEGKRYQYLVMIPESNYIQWELEYTKHPIKRPQVSIFSVHYRVGSSLAVL